MSRFKKSDFNRVIKEIEKMEEKNENIWVPLGILEMMYDDDCAWIDEYFDNPPEHRNIDKLWEKLLKHLENI